MSAILQELTEQENAKRENAITEYLAIAKRLADGGDDPEFKHVQAVLAAVNKTSADLTKAVSNRKWRKARAAEIAAVDAADIERAEFNQQLAAANAVVGDAMQKRDLIAERMKWRCLELDQINYRAAHARKALRESCDDESLVFRYEEANRKLASLTQPIQQLAKVKNDLRDELRDGGGDKRKKLLAEQDRVVVNLQELERQRDALLAEVESVLDEMQTV